MVNRSAYSLSLLGARSANGLCRGKARQGKAGQGKARQGKARQGKARQGRARQGKARQDCGKEKPRQGQGKAQGNAIAQGNGKITQGTARGNRVRLTHQGIPFKGNRFQLGSHGGQFCLGVSLLRSGLQAFVQIFFLARALGQEVAHTPALAYFLLSREKQAEEGDNQSEHQSGMDSYCRTKIGGKKRTRPRVTPGLRVGTAYRSWYRFREAQRQGFAKRCAKISRGQSTKIKNNIHGARNSRCSKFDICNCRQLVCIGGRRRRSNISASAVSKRGLFFWRGRFFKNAHSFIVHSTHDGLPFIAQNSVQVAAKHYF